MLKPTTYRAPRSPRIVVVHIDNLLLLLASMVITGPPLPRARVVLCPESSTAWSSTLIPKAARPPVLLVAVVRVSARAVRTLDPWRFAGIGASIVVV